MLTWGGCNWSELDTVFCFLLFKYLLYASNSQIHISGLTFPLFPLLRLPTWHLLGIWKSSQTSNIQLSAWLVPHLNILLFTPANNSSTRTQLLSFPCTPTHGGVLETLPPKYFLKLFVFPFFSLLPLQPSCRPFFLEFYQPASQFVLLLLLQCNSFSTELPVWSYENYIESCHPSSKNLLMAYHHTGNDTQNHFSNLRSPALSGPESHIMHAPPLLTESVTLLVFVSQIQQATSCLQIFPPVLSAWNPLPQVSAWLASSCH